MGIRRWLQHRWRRIKRLPWAVLGVLVGAAVVSSLVGLRGDEEGLRGVWLNLGTELAGAAVTFVLIDLFLGTRERKASLMAKVGSNVRGVAVAAADEMRREGWLSDGSLKGQRLDGANLEGAWLRAASLEWANLSEAVLTGASLEGASLRGAVMKRATLDGATLTAATLEGCSLEWATLRGAVLTGANLQGAGLTRADLEGAVLTGANLEGAWLRTANLARCDLRDATLRGASLRGANLEGASVPADALDRTKILAGATLPNGRELSKENWEAELEAWRKRGESGACYADT